MTQPTLKVAEDSMTSESPVEEQNAQVLNVRGYQYLLKGDCEEAIVCFVEALHLTPSNPVILNNLGNALLKLNRYKEARDNYQKAIAARPDYLKPYCNLALLYQLTNQTHEAIAAYRFYLSKAPDDGEAQHNLGLLCMNAGLREEAAAAFEAAARSLQPDSAESATNLGVGYFFRGEPDRSVELFERALAFDETYVQARYHLGVAYLHQARCQESIAMLEQVVAVAPDYPQAKSALGVAYNTAGEPLKAIAVFEELLRQEPDQPGHTLNLGYACQEAQFNERAIECFEQVLGLRLAGDDYKTKARRALGQVRDIPFGRAGTP